MTVSALHLHPDDTVACLLRDHLAGETAMMADGPTAPLSADVPMGHKIALRAMDSGAPVIKYGAQIGCATTDIAPGDHVHLHNLRGSLG